MATEIIMPKVDMVMETGTFVEWLSNEGDQVAKGQPLFVITTDKASIEIEAPASGILAGLRARPDEVIPVTQTIAYILEPGEKLPGQLEVAQTENMPRTQPVSASPNPALSAAISDSGAGIHPGKVRATPVARKMAAQLGVDLVTMQGRGPKGRIHKADVLTTVEKQVELQTDRPSIGFPDSTRGVQTPAQAFVGLSIPLPAARRKQVVPLVGPRKIIAQRMAYSATVAPHITLTTSVDMSEPARLRSHVQSRLEQKTGYRLSYTAMIAWVVAKVLGNHPFLNSSLAGDEIILWEDVHLGIALNIEDYLVVPVIREAQAKTLEEIMLSLGDALDRARSRKLMPSEMSGSTFTISNLGMHGIESFTAIINPPEVAILAVGSIVDTFIKVDQAIVEKPMMKLTICADHRVVDGVAAANFLKDVKNTLENPYLIT